MDGQSIVAYVSIPVSRTRNEYRFYTYNSNGEKVAQTPALSVESINSTKPYLTLDGKYVVMGTYTGSYDIENFFKTVVIELATGNIIASYDNILLYSQVYGTDQFIIMEYSDRYERKPYSIYTIVTINGSGIDTLSTLRLLGANSTFTNSYDPVFASKKRLITSEYDSLNTLYLVVRDSSKQVLYTTLAPQYPNLTPSISSNGDKVIYSGYDDRNGFIFDLSNGTIDTSFNLSFPFNKAQVTMDGAKIIGEFDDNVSNVITSYDIEAKTRTVLNTFDTRKYIYWVSLSPDNKRLATVLSEGNRDDQLVVLPLP